MERDWPAYVRGLVRAEMARRGVTYGDLAGRLAELGVTDETGPKKKKRVLNEVNLRNQIARGSFSAVLLAQVMIALGCTYVRLDFE
jgi:hypothetical protein